MLVDWERMVRPYRNRAGSQSSGVTRLRDLTPAARAAVRSSDYMLLQSCTGSALLCIKVQGLRYRW